MCIYGIENKYHIYKSNILFGIARTFGVFLS